MQQMQHMVLLEGLRVVPIDYRVTPINLINKYVWDCMRGNVDGIDAIDPEIFDALSYSYMPIFPVHENQAINTTGYESFILYDYLFDESPGAMWEMKCERAMLTIISHAPMHLYGIKNYIQDLLNKHDQTARSINGHINNDSIRFKFVKCSQDLFQMQEMKQTERSFAPRFATTLSLYYDYTRS